MRRQSERLFSLFHNHVIISNTSKLYMLKMIMIIYLGELGNGIRMRELKDEYV